MTIVKIHEAKTNPSKLIARVEAGEEIVIVRGDKPVAKAVPMTEEARRPHFGALKRKLPHIPDEFFFDPLPEEELRAWEGMRILFDSHSLFWFLEGSPRLWLGVRRAVSE